MAEDKVKVMVEAGATREKSWIAVAQALDATKLIVDKYGEEHTEDDHAIRLRAAELIARATGDIKPDGAITNNTINVVSISKEDFKRLLDEDRKIKRSGQSGEIIDVQAYRA